MEKIFEYIDFLSQPTKPIEPSVIIMDKYNICAQLLFLGGWVGINFAIYFIFHVMLSNSELGYNRLPRDKRRYTVKNLTKSMILAGIVFYGFPRIYKFYFIDRIWNNDSWTYLGHVYTSTDIAVLVQIN